MFLAILCYDNVCSKLTKDKSKQDQFKRLLAEIADSRQRQPELAKKVNENLEDLNLNSVLAYRKRKLPRRHSDVNNAIKQYLSQFTKEMINRMAQETIFEIVRKFARKTPDGHVDPTCLDENEVLGDAALFKEPFRNILLQQCAVGLNNDRSGGRNCKRSFLSTTNPSSLQVPVVRRCVSIELDEVKKRLGIKYEKKRYINAQAKEGKKRSRRKTHATAYSDDDEEVTAEGAASATPRATGPPPTTTTTAAAAAASASAAATPGATRPPPTAPTTTAAAAATSASAADTPLATPGATGPPPTAATTASAAVTAAADEIDDTATEQAVTAGDISSSTAPDVAVSSSDTANSSDTETESGEEVHNNYYVVQLLVVHCCVLGFISGRD